MPGIKPGMTEYGGLRRLLRRHLVHLAGLEVDADAVDLVEIGSGYTHEARMVGIVDGVDLAVLIDAGLARIEPVLLRWLEARMLGIGTILLPLPSGHAGLLPPIAVDRP